MTVSASTYQLDLALLPIAAVVVDSRGRVTWVNSEAERVLAAGAEKLRDRLWSDIVAAVDTAGPVIAARATDSGAMFSIRRFDNHESGDTVFLLSDFVDDPWLDNGLVTLQRLYQRGGMSGGIAHEINNFLAIIQGNVELMPLLMGKGDQEKIEKKLELMKRSCESITKLCDGFMDLCEDKPRLVPCNVNHVVEHALQFLTPQNMFDNVTVSTDLNDSIPLVQADPGLLQQAVINILVNAATAVAGRDEASVSIRTSIESDRDRRTIRIAVSDNGSGLKNSVRGGLLHRRVSSDNHRLGLGLLVAQRILVAHDGSVDFEEMSDGTVVALAFPVKPVETDAARQSTISSRQS